MAEPGFVDVGGLRTWVHVEGEQAAAPVLLLHGISRSLQDWAPQLDRLAGTHRVIALDLPGFGRSARRSEPMTVSALARGVLATLDALDERRPVHVLGNSLGGAVSLQLLASAPERVVSVVLVNSAGFGREVTYLLRMLAIPGFGRAALRRPTRLGTRHAERSLFATKTLATPERIEHALTLSRDPAVAAVMAEMLLALGGLRGAHEPWRRELLAAAAAHRRPVLIVWGDRDRILPPQHFEAARRAFPHARTHMFPRTGHMPQIERADEFAALVRDFLAGIA